MSDLFETSGIPDRPEYWERQTTRVGDAVRADRVGGFAALGSTRWCLPAAAAALVAAGIVIVVALAGPPAGRVASVSWEAAFAPDDVLGEALILASAPPSVPELLSRSADASQRSGERR